MLCIRRKKKDPIIIIGQNLSKPENLPGDGPLAGFLFGENNKFTN